MKNFDEFYNELKNIDNNELEKLWKEAKIENDKAKKISIIICTIIDILYTIMFFRNGMISSMVFIMFPMVMFAVITNSVIVVIVKKIFSKKENEYNKKFKEIVINKLMCNFYDNLKYFPSRPMPRHIYGNLRYEYFNRYKSDDYFEALIDNKNSIQMAEILAQEEETHTDSDGNTQTTTTTKFHGLFAKILLEKSIDSELRIMQNRSLFRINKLKMDSKEFEKYFEVKATNNIIGMQLLTADVMDELVEFVTKTKIKFDIVIRGDELYLRFHSGTMFETGKIKNGAIDRELLQKYFYILNFTYRLSKKIINTVNDTEI